MKARELLVTIRTPRQVVLERPARSLRVPTETGQVGLRPRCESTVLAVLPGLVLVRHASGLDYVGSAGGLLRCDGKQATLLTPLAVSAEDEASVLDRLETALAAPDEEIQARRTLDRLESTLLRQLRTAGAARPEGVRRGS